MSFRNASVSLKTRTFNEVLLLFIVYTRLFFDTHCAE